MDRAWLRKLHSLHHPPLYNDHEGAAIVRYWRESGEQYLMLGQQAPNDSVRKEVLQFCRGIAAGDYVKFGAPLRPNDLPCEYGLKGGAARALLAQVLGRRSFAPRDQDLVRFGQARTPHDDAVAARFMTHDWERGAGVELVAGLDTYFTTRDLTANEVLYFDGELTISWIGLLDTLGYVLRPCRYRSGTLRRPRELAARTALKMLRLRAEGLVLGEEWLIAGIPKWQVVTEFDIALHLDRAFARGERAAEHFIELCIAQGFVEEGERNINDLLLSLCLAVPGGADFFRELPADLAQSLQAAYRQALTTGQG